MTYPTYPSAPPNSPYTPWRSYEQAAANAEATPQPATARGPWVGRYGLIFGAITIGVTVAALVLAVLGAGLAPRATSLTTSGMTQVFDGVPTDGGQWDNTGPCSFTSTGLDVTSDSGAEQCQYKPSVNSDFTSQGFILEATVAPAGSVQGQESAVLSGGGFIVEVTQQGTFEFCAATQLPCTIGTPSVTGSTDAWHTDAYVSNTVILRYNMGLAEMNVYVNGQEVATLQASQISGPVALGTGSGGEAVFTHITLYSATGS